MDLDAAAVDEEPFRDAIDPGELGEDPFPHAAFGPAPEAVVERFFRTVDMFLGNRPSDHRSSEPGQSRKARAGHRPLASRAYRSARAARSLLEARESHCSAGVNPVYGSGP